MDAIFQSCDYARVKGIDVRRRIALLMTVMAAAFFIPVL
jgi:hypothetical protein